MEQQRQKQNEQGGGTETTAFESSLVVREGPGADGYFEELRRNEEEMKAKWGIVPLVAKNVLPEKEDTEKHH